MPPASSALLLYLAPNRLPTFTPTMDNAKVITPIKLTAAPMFTLKKAKLTPTARASMLVATAMGSMAFTDREASGHSSSLERDSRIIFPPMMASSAKAIQWSMAVICSLNCTPTK